MHVQKSYKNVPTILLYTICAYVRDKSCINKQNFNQVFTGGSYLKLAPFTLANTGNSKQLCLVVLFMLIVELNQPVWFNPVRFHMMNTSLLVFESVSIALLQQMLVGWVGVYMCPAWWQVENLLPSLYIHLHSTNW